MAATAPPPHGHRHGDDDYARRLNRRASSFRSSVAEADRCRRSMASPTDAIRRRRSRASPPSPNRRPRCGTRPSDDNSFMPGGADDHPPRRSRVSDGEESDRRRRRARVSDDEREDGRRQMRSGVSDDQRDSRRVKLCRRIPSPERGLCPDDHRVDRWRRQDDCRRMEDNHGKCSTSLERREQMTREVKGDASPEYQRQHEWSPEHQRHYWDALEKCMEYHKQNKATLEYQRHSWDALDKNISELLNKVNASNINDILSELFAQNLIRGRGLFCQSCIKAQMASPLFTDVFAALVAVVNTKFPEIGHLLLVRVVLHLKRAFKRNDMVQLLAATKFVAHLVNQVVARELVALELLEVLLVNRTDDSVKVAVVLVKECGAMLQLLSPQRLHAIFERFRRILHEGEIGKHVQLLIKGLFAIRKTNFKGFPPIRPELDLVDQENKFTHDISLEDELDPETNLNLFRVNPNFIEYEKACENIKKSMLGPECCKDEQMETSNEYETGFLTLKRILRSTVMASAYFEEAGLVKIEVKPGQEMELCATILECCFEDRIYRRYFGLLAQRYCMMRKVYQENFEKCFMEQYSMAHQLETCKLCIVAKFFAHLLETDTLPWHVLACIRLTEEQASSTRIFVKVLFQELLKHLGIQRLKEKLNNPDVQGFFGSVFPEDHPRNLRFAISFFTAIGLGVITEKFREKLPQPASSGSQSSSGYESSSGSE